MRSICRVNGQTGDGVMAALHNEHPGEFDSELQILDAPIFDTQLSDGRILGPETAYLSVSCGWDVMPRRPQILDPDNSIYKNIVKKYLDSQGLSDTNPQLMQLYRVDLEGDGTDEVIICAQNILTDAESRAQWGNDVPLLVNADSPSEGDYSIVLLRKIVDGKVLDIPLGQFIALRDEADTDSGWSSYRLYKIYQFADLNGDGTLEIILGMRMSEGNAYQIHMVKDGKASMVLENGIYQ